MSDFTKAAVTKDPSQAPRDQEPSESQRVDKIPYNEEEEPMLQGQNAFNSERPLNVKPTQSGKCGVPWLIIPLNIRITLGGVARDGREGLPMGKAGLVDKAIGKVEKVRSIRWPPFSSSDLSGHRRM